MIIRQFSHNETDAAADLLARCLNDTMRDLIPATALAAFSVARSRARILEAPDATLVIEEGGKLVGIGQTRQDEIVFIYLDRLAQGRGLGKALLDVLLLNVRTAGHKAAWLYVLDTNKRARNFYAHLGWQETETAGIDLNGVTLHHIKCVCDI